MDTGLTIKPGTGVVAQDYAPPIAASAQPDTTELPAAKTVTPAATTTAARNDVPSTTHEVIIDPQTREVIYRVIDVRTGQVQRQVPDAALMRMRAYTRAMADGKSPLDAGADTDNMA